MPFEWAFLMDAIQAERDQGITIDTTQIWFRTAEAALRHHRRAGPQGVPQEHGDRRRLLRGGPAADRRRTRACRSSRAGTAICCICWASSRWRCWSTRWTWSATRPTASARSPRSTAPICAGSASTPACIIPISAREGDNMVEHSPAHALVPGPDRAAGAGRASSYKELPTERPLRMPVQDVYKFDQRRIIAGRIESGTARGSATRWCSRRRTRPPRSRSIEAWHVPERAGAGAGRPERSASRSTEQIFVERGEVMSHLEHAPIESNVFKARLFWLGHKPLQVGKSYTLKLGTLEAPVTVEAIERVIDTSDLSTKGAEQDRAQRRRRGRAAHQAHAGARRARARTRSPAGSSWSRTTCRWAAASSRWRATPTSAS